MDYPLLLSTWLTLLTLLLTDCLAQTCTKVNQLRASCSSAGDIRLECPKGHRVYIQYARPQVLLQPGCSTSPEALATACSAETLTYYIRNYICTTGQSCTILASIFRDTNPRQCRDYQGENILSYQYLCEPDDIPNLSICSTRTYTRSYLSLVSNYNSIQQLSIASSDLQSIGSTDCGCNLLIPPNTEVKVTRTLFVKSDNVYNNCAQTLVIEDPDGPNGNGILYMCPTSDYVVTLGCESFERSVFLRYETLNKGVQVKFILNFTVSHDTNIHMQCGFKPTTPAPTTTTTTVTSTTTTTPTTTTVTTTPTSTTTTSTPTTTTTVSSTSPTTTTASSKTTPPINTKTTPPTTKATPEPKRGANEVLPFGTETFIGIVGGGVVFLVLLTVIISVACTSSRRPGGGKGAAGKGAAPKNASGAGTRKSATSTVSGVYEVVGDYFATPYETPLSRPPYRQNSFNYATDTMPYSSQFRVSTNEDVLHNPVYGKSPYNDIFQY